MATRIKLTIELEKLSDKLGSSGPQLALEFWNDFCKGLETAGIFQAGVKGKLIDHVRLTRSETVKES